MTHSPRPVSRLAGVGNDRTRDGALHSRRTRVSIRLTAFINRSSYAALLRGRITEWRRLSVCLSVCPVRHVGPIISKQKVLETSSLQILLQILSHARIYWYRHYRADQIKVTRSG